ncbi:hypothetical protein Dimus_035155 [Dionaea muscipula]
MALSGTERYGTLTVKGHFDSDACWISDVPLCNSYSIYNQHEMWIEDGGGGGGENTHTLFDPYRNLYGRESTGTAGSGSRNGRFRLTLPCGFLGDSTQLSVSNPSRGMKVK